MARGQVSRLYRDEALMCQVIGEYLAGATLHDLACRHAIGWDALRRALVEHGIEIRQANWHKIKPYAGKKILSDEEVARLRQLIGYKPWWR